MQAPTKKLPPHWKISGEPPKGSHVSVDPDVSSLGKPAVLLHSPTAAEHADLFLYQSIDGNAFYGKRLRFSCFVKTEKAVGEACILVYAQDHGGRQVIYDSMVERSLSGDNDWTELFIVVDVPTDGRWISFGPCLTGKGKLWAAQFKIEEVSKDVPRTDDHGRPSKVGTNPVNLGFNQTAADGLFEGPCALAAGWQSPTESEGMNFSVLEASYDGANVAVIDSRPKTEADSGEDQFAFLCQSFQAKPFRGHRIKFSSAIKTEGVEGRAVLVLMVNGVQYQRLALSTMSAEALVGDNDWAVYSQVLDVSDFAYSVTIWLQITGIGKVYFSKVAVETVDEDVPTTDGHHLPKNLDFSE